jgi:hypothetical protein
MSAINTLNRRTLLSAAASLVATGASFMLLPKGYAEPRRGADDHMQDTEWGTHSVVQGGHHSDDEIKKCAQLCQDCHALCTETIQHCLKLGGRHAAPEHIGLLLDCAQLCETTAQYLLRRSSLHERVCALCADVCRQCAENCVQLSGDDPMVKQCAELCRRCAGSCERMGSKAGA